MSHIPRISVVIPTYRRERVLVETLQRLLVQLAPADEMLVVDQTAEHEPATTQHLRTFHSKGVIRWIRQSPPSITAAMNRGLLEADCEVAVFLDDDIEPEGTLLSAHREAHATQSRILVAGRVIQPWERGSNHSNPSTSIFAADKAAWVEEFMGSNFSLRRDHALELGGFDENFVQVAYRYEADFARRFRAAGGRIRFEPLAGVHHLRVAAGGTRSYGDHLTTVMPAHAVGAYYFALQTNSHGRWPREFVTRLVRAVATRHHLRRPWWIPVTLCAELRGMWWAMRLHNAGPKLIRTPSHVP